MQRAVIIDTDPGYDDAIAILLAARHLNILGLTTVFGNESIENTTQNALNLLDYCGLSGIPVAKGAEFPLIQKLTPGGGSSIHGKNGLETPLLSQSKNPVHPNHAVDFIIETALLHKDLTLIPVGPLTNIALALQKAPAIREHIKEICIMGGSVTLGNASPVAEVNIWCDPEAAHIVFNSGIHIKMVGLNVTYSAMSTPDRRERFHQLTNKVGRLASDIIDRYSSNYTKIYNYPGAALHDPCAVAWLIDPSIIESMPAHMDIELHGQLTRGMTVCDLRPPRNIKPSKSDENAPRVRKPANGEVALKINSDRFFDLLYSTLEQYP